MDLETVWMALGLGIELDMAGKFIFGPMLTTSKPMPLRPAKVDAELVNSGGLDLERDAGLQSMEIRERERDIARQSIGITLDYECVYISSAQSDAKACHSLVI